MMKSLSSVSRLLNISLLGFSLLGLGGPAAWAGPEKTAGKVEQGKKKKKAKKVTKSEAGEDAIEELLKKIQIASPQSSFDRQFNQALARVVAKLAHPEDERVGGASLLAHAVWRGNAEAMKVLVQHGADVKSLRYAAHALPGGNVECLKFLREKGLPLAVNAGYGHARNSVDDCLRRAAASGNLACFKYVVEWVSPLLPEDKRAILGIWQIQDAASDGGNLEIFDYLEKEGVKTDPEFRLACLAKSGNSELFFQEVGRSGSRGRVEFLVRAAIQGGNVDILKYCVEHGGAVSERESERFEYKSPLLCAAENGALECFRYLEEKGAVYRNTLGSLSEYAARSGNPEMLRYVAARETNKQNINKALCVAARYGHLDACRILVEESGAAVDEEQSFSFPGRQRFASTPMKLAVSSGNMALVKYLERKGARVDAATMAYAAGLGYPRLLDYLLKNYPLRDAAGQEEVLAAAAAGAHPACLKMLLKRKFKVTKRCMHELMKGFLMPHIIKENSVSPASLDDTWPDRGRIESLKLLVRHGGNIHETYMRGALVNFHCNLVMYLDKQGVKLDEFKSFHVVGGAQVPAIPFAASIGRIDVMKMLFKRGEPIVHYPQERSFDPLLLCVMAAAAYYHPSYGDCIRLLTSKGERLSNKDLTWFTSNERQPDGTYERYIPDQLRKVLRETHGR